MISSATFIRVHRVPTVLWGLWMQLLNSTVLQIFNFHSARAHPASLQLGCVFFVAVSS